MCKCSQRKRKNTYSSYKKKFESEKDNIFKDPRYFIQIEKKNKKQIFIIIKKGKNGRRKKLNKIGKYTYYNSNRQHNKLSEDNIIRKLKRYFTHSLLDFVNKLYELEKNYLEIEKKFKEKNSQKRHEKWLQIIKSKIVTKIAKKENLKWFDSKIKDYLSSEVSPKCKNFNKNYNKVQIEKLCEQNMFNNLSNFLQETNIRLMFEIYAKDCDFGVSIGSLHLKFLTLKNDINQMINEEIDDSDIDSTFPEENTDIEKYTSKIREIAINLEKIFKNKRHRSKNLVVVEI